MKENLKQAARVACVLAAAYGVFVLGTGLYVHFRQHNEMFAYLVSIEQARQAELAQQAQKPGEAKAGEKKPAKAQAAK